MGAIRWWALYRNKIINSTAPNTVHAIASVTQMTRIANRSPGVLGFGSSVNTLTAFLPRKRLRLAGSIHFASSHDRRKQRDSDR